MPNLFGHVELTYIKLDHWGDEAINKVASSLSKCDLSSAAVYLWLHDTQVFNHEESGRPLEADFCSRLHCTGKLGVVSQWKMQNLWDQAMPILEACKQAVRILFITPLPIYLTTPCCEDPGHCVGLGQLTHFRGVTNAVASLHDATMRWVSRLKSPRMAVVCPHLELMDAARKQKEDARESLSDAYCYDGIHLTFAGYTTLSALIWNAMTQNFYRLMPPPNMMPPQRGPPEPTRRVSARSRLGPWVGPGLHPEFEDNSPERIVACQDEDLRIAERGPWANHDMQDQGPIIPADVWEEARRMVYDQGYKPAPGGGRPG
jgi:hypothetical protein